MLGPFLWRSYEGGSIVPGSPWEGVQLMDVVACLIGKLRQGAVDLLKESFTMNSKRQLVIVVLLFALFFLAPFLINEP